MPGTVYSKGFTLIELLLAMAISAFVAIAGYQGLRVAIDASEAVENQSRQLADIQLALGILEQDIGNAITRPVRNELGTLEAIMSGGLSNDALLLLTRDGWSNPRGSRRSDLARVQYSWDGENLVRKRWLVLDRVGLEEGLEEVLVLENVTDIRVEFFTPYRSEINDNQPAGTGLNGQWVDWWHSERLGLDYAEPLPALVRITLTVSGFGQLTRIIPVVAA